MSSSHSLFLRSFITWPNQQNHKSTNQTAAALALFLRSLLPAKSTKSQINSSRSRSLSPLFYYRPNQQKNHKSTAAVLVSFSALLLPAKSTKSQINESTVAALALLRFCEFVQLVYALIRNNKQPPARQINEFTNKQINQRSPSHFPQNAYICFLQVITTDLVWI